MVICKSALLVVAALPHVTEGLGVRVSGGLGLGFDPMFISFLFNYLGTRERSNQNQCNLRGCKGTTSTRIPNTRACMIQSHLAHDPLYGLSYLPAAT